MSLETKFLPLATEEEPAPALVVPQYSQASSEPENFSVPPSDGAPSSVPSSVPSFVSDALGGVSDFFGPTRGRENHLFFGFCCDSRRAVLAVNGISIAWDLISMLILHILLLFAEDQVKADVDVDEKEVKLVEELFDIFQIVFIFMHACGIYGAIKYQAWAVWVSLVAYGLAPFFFKGIYPWPIRIFQFICIYPHIIFLREVKSGVMADYNYDRVKHCCDCCGV